MTSRPRRCAFCAEEFGVQVLDRSGLFLDIFAQRAKTKEGRLQVELAQTPIGILDASGAPGRARAKGPHRLEGPRGETQLFDRRHIHRKIDKLKADLEEVPRVRHAARPPQQE